MADNNTQYKINFNGTEMILNENDLKSIELLLLSKHSGLSDKRKAAYKELLNDYLDSIIHGESFDLSSYNYGDSKPIFRNQRDNAVKYDLLSELNRRSKQQSSNLQLSTLNELNLAQYNVLTNRLNNITFFNNDSEDNVNKNLDIIKNELKKIDGLDQAAIDLIGNADSFILFMNNNRDKLNEDTDNVETLASYLTLKKPEPNPNEGKQLFGSTSIYYNPSLGEKVIPLITNDNQSRFLYYKDINGTPTPFVINDKGEELRGEQNTVFGHYFDNGKAKIAMNQAGQGLNVYDYDPNNTPMYNYNRSFDYTRGKISQYEAGNLQNFNYILDMISELSNIIKGLSLNYIDITGLIDGFGNNGLHVFLLGNKPLYFGDISERDAYIYDENTKLFQPVRIQTKNNRFIINGEEHNRNQENNYDPLKFLSKFDFGIDASTLNNIEPGGYSEGLDKFDIVTFIDNFKNSNINLKELITSEDLRQNIRNLYYVLKRHSNEHRMPIEESIRIWFNDKGIEYVTNLVTRMTEIMRDFKNSQKSSSNNNNGSNPVNFGSYFDSFPERYKYGGVLKYALGAEISNQLANATVREDKLPTEEELNQLEQEYLNSISPRYKRKLQEGYLPINGSGTAEHQWNAHDTADIVAGGMDLASLMGGLPGIILSGAALVTDLINQGTDDRYTKADVFKNLGLNLGFMLLSAIPGAASAKFAKNAQKAHKQLQTIDKFIRNSETGRKLADKAGNKAVDKLIAATEEALKSKELKSLWLEKVASKAERAINTGGAAVGLYAGYEGVKSAAEDIREHRGVSTTSIRLMVGGLAGGLSLGRGLERLAIRRVTEPVTGVTTTTSIGNSIDVGINKSKLSEAEREFIKFKKGDQQFFDEDGKLYLDTSNISNKTELKEAVTAKKEEIKKAYEEMLLEEVETPLDGSSKVLTPENIKKKEDFNKFIDDKVKASPKVLSLLKQKAKNKAVEAKESFKQTIRGDFDERYPRQLKSLEDLDNMIFLRHLGEWRARKRGYVNVQEGLDAIPISQKLRIQKTIDELVNEVIRDDKKKSQGERLFEKLYTKKLKQNRSLEETVNLADSENTNPITEEKPKVEVISENANGNVGIKEPGISENLKLIYKKIRENGFESFLKGLSDEEFKAFLKELSSEEYRIFLNNLTDRDRDLFLERIYKIRKNTKAQNDIDESKKLASEIANVTSKNIAKKAKNGKKKDSNTKKLFDGGSIIGEDKTKDKKERNVDLTALTQIPEMLLALSVNRKNREGLNVKAPKIDKVEYYTPVSDNFALTQYYLKLVDNIMRQAELLASQYSDPSIRLRIMSSALKQVQLLSDKAAMENVSTFNKSKSELTNNAIKFGLLNNEIDYKNKQIDYKNKLQEEQLKAAERIKNYESAITGLKELKHNMFLTKQQSDQMKMADKKLELSLSYQNEYKLIVAKYSDAGKDILKQFLKQFPNGDINSEDGNRKILVGQNITYKLAYDKAVNDAKQQMQSELLELKLKYERLNNHMVVPTNPNQYTIDVRAKGGSLSFNEKMQLERLKRIHNQIKHNLEIAKENEKRLRNQIDPAVNSLNKERLLVLNSILKG